ncbi:MAG: hypothetical protein ABJD07_03870 [Gemmatimonadaceae bacterium]
MPSSAVRPRSASEIIDAAIQLFREHFTPMLVISAVASLPSLLVGVYNAIVFLPVFASGVIAQRQLQALARFYGLFFVSYAWFVVVSGAVVLVAAAAYEGRTLAPVDALRTTFSRAHRILGAAVLKWIVVGFFAFLGIVVASITAAAFELLTGGSMITSRGAIDPAAAGIFLLVMLLAVGLGVALAARPFARYFGFLPAIMLENTTARGALLRSKTLAAGSYLKILGTLVATYVIYLIIAFTAVGLMRLFTFKPLAQQLVSGLLATLVSPILTITVTLLYFDLRIQREGYDLELLATKLGDPPPPAQSMPVP